VKTYSRGTYKGMKTYSRGTYKGSRGTYKGSRGTLQSFLTSSLGRCEWSTSRSGRYNILIILLYFIALYYYIIMFPVS